MTQADMPVANVVMRDAIPGDAQAMVRLAHQSQVAAHWREQDYTRIFDNDAVSRIALVLVQGSQIVGFVIATCATPDWELENIVVSDEQRRRGLGDRLMAELLDRAKQASAESVFLEVRDSNQAARALYRKWGFAEIGIRKEYYSFPTEDGLIYRRRL